MLPEYAILVDRRLAHDWTWQQLADDVHDRAGIQISARTLHYLTKHDDVHARDRTLHKIRQYLAAIEHEGPNDRRRALRRRRARLAREATQ
jgi:hypothetical protein